MGDCLKFPSIGQFRQTIRNVVSKATFAGLDADGNAIYRQVKLPTISFLGTVKLHGTNSSFKQFNKNGELFFQSRERVLTLQDDNAGFMTKMNHVRDKLSIYMSTIREVFEVPDNETLTVYGEWCGGNIQKGVAINGLPKMMVMFAIRVGEEIDPKWYYANDDRFGIVKNLDEGIYSIGQFPTFELSIDFNHPEEVQNTLIKITQDVETECPVAASFGSIGTGEGVVWTPITEGWKFSEFCFKVKGEKHSVTKVIKLASVDVEKVTAIKELVDVVITNNRLEQMLDNLQNTLKLEIEPKNVGTFISLCMTDAAKEESDTIIDNGFTMKEFSKFAIVKIRIWFLNKI